MTTATEKTPKKPATKPVHATALVLRLKEGEHDNAPDDIVASYDLAAPIVPYQFILNRNGKKFELEIQMRPYSTDRVIRLLKQREPFRIPSTEDKGMSEFARTDDDLEKEFFDEHVVSVSLRGEKLNEGQLSQIDAWSNIKNNVINLGYNGLTSLISDQMTEEGSIDDLLGGGSVTHSHVLSDGKVEHSVDITHHHAEPSAKDGTDYRRAIKIRTKTAGNRQSEKISTNHDIFRKLYRKLVTSVDGLEIAGDPCSESNREEWIDRVPYFMQADCVLQIFRASQRKN